MVYTSGILNHLSLIILSYFFFKEEAKYEAPLFLPVVNIH